MIRDDIVKEVLTWTNTPYQHQAMVKGENGGVDCAMLVAGVALNLGLITQDDIDKVPAYSPDWHAHSDVPRLVDTMKLFGAKRRRRGVKLRNGDILTFKIGRTISHLGVYIGDGNFIHAEGRGPMRVTITTLNGPWLDRLEDIYLFPGVV